MPQTASDPRLAINGSPHNSATSGDNRVPPILAAGNPRLARHAAGRSGRCPTAEVVRYSACMGGKCKSAGENGTLTAGGS
eukprot:CAMPEP_0177243496 /NCGR_PEP_ID=MMETSP0367-20130122/49370_1 /TAXON_ID=447022 ORGANISM="Scrippsiella hangoei-like, Strain SHHI-4" /NCGR_SAMPLE_ID=MMETSP0367 /ASSEMBLY_ACC=CAM_ASM_000362 /LENGTH=79 /DNA_ID=CAMNT_0018695179 /DNA_START=159 /DNA_END=399 /DNA_ORIENTATION=+